MDIVSVFSKSTELDNEWILSILATRNTSNEDWNEYAGFLKSL